MLELHGRGFVIDHCIVQFEREQEEKSYRIYIANNLRLVCENVGKGLGGSYYPGLWGEIEPNDDRTGDEVALDVIKRAGLIVRGGDS